MSLHQGLLLADCSASAVMAGLVPAIHAVEQTAARQYLIEPSVQQFTNLLQLWRRVTAWMAGTGPAMTASEQAAEAFETSVSF